jgi:hypothetical protein
MTWFVQQCAQYAKNKMHDSYRVQRWVQQGHDNGAYEMAFVHEDKALCETIAALLNQWPIEPIELHSWGRDKVIQIRIPHTL